MPPSRIRACREVSVARSRATIRHPLVSRSRRCTSSRLSRGRDARSASITPKLTPLPPCTARPAGLSMTSTCLSSKAMACSNQPHQAVRRTAGLRVRVDAHRRQAQLVALLNSILGLDALSIHAHFSLAQQPIDAAARHGLPDLEQEVVDALAGLPRRSRHGSVTAASGARGTGAGSVRVFQVLGEFLRNALTC